MLVRAKVIQFDLIKEKIKMEFKKSIDSALSKSEVNCYAGTI